MTMLGRQKFTCANCHHEDDYMTWASTNSFGSPDLDTRPAGDYRFALNMLLVKKCKNCGYCNDKLDKPFENLNGIIQSDEYQSQLANECFPEKANEFLCKSILLEKNNELYKAAWASLHAAWSCDDSENHKQSKYCRKRAISLLNQYSYSVTEKQKQENDTIETLLVDLYRRIGEFDLATKKCDSILANECDILSIQILVFQKHLCVHNDIRRHTIQNAIIFWDDFIKKEPT